MATEFVGIELQLMGADGVRRDLQQLDRLLQSLGGKKKFDAGFNEARQQVVAYKGELEKLKREYSSIIADNKKVISNSKDSAKALTDAYKKGLISLKEYREAFHELATQSREAASSNKAMNAEIDATRQKMWNAQQAVREFGQASREAGRTFKETFNAISSKVAHIGSAMQSFGNAMTQLTSPFRRITDGIMFGAGYKVLNQFTEGIENSFTRADVMRKYPRVMQAMGYSAQEAENSITKLDLAVQGLPTSLDDIVGMSQRFTSTLGDLTKGTDLAIAANNAFLASMSTETQKYQGMMQLQDVIGGKKMNAKEWQALANSMMPAIRMMGESLGYEGQELKDYVARVQQGKVANEEFLETLIKAGTDANGKIRQIALESLDTWEAFFSRIRTAASRLGYKGIIEPLNELVKTVTGGKFESVNLLLDDFIINRIDKMQSSVRKWIQAHPEEITNFFKDLSKIKVGEFFRGYARGLEVMVGLVEKLGTALGKHPKLMTFLGGFFGMGGTIGRMSTIFGGLLKGTRHIWGLLGAGGSWLLKGRLGKIGIFGKIASFFGKKKDIEEVGEIGKAVTTASPKLLSAFKNMALLSGIIATPAITAWGVTEAVKRSIKNFKETINLLKDMDWGAAAKLAGGIAGFLGASAGLGAIVGKFGIGAGIDIMIGEVIVGLITSIATGFADLNMAFIKGSIEKFVESIRLLNDIPDVSSFGDVKTKISNAIEMMNEITTLLNGEWTGPGMHEGGISNVGLGAVMGINTLAKALAPMKDAVQRINEIASMSISEGAVNNIGKIIDAISEIQSKMWKLMGFGFGNIKNNMTKVADAMYELRRVIYHVNKLGSEKINDAGLKNVGDAISKIREAFDARAIADLRATITTFVAARQDARKQFDVFNKPIEIKATVKLSKDFKKSVDTTVKQIESAKGRIRRAWNGIPTSFSKTITFTLKARVIADNLYAGASKAREIAASVHPAKGGLIYRARGGGVPFKRRGTDTVPAMLTPGEYVHNKRAVDTFGIDFMRKVNNLDMKGAMNELMHRAGHMANINRGTNITNNNYNNQKVVINNSNAGAGYTFKTASRFVGAF